MNVHGCVSVRTRTDIYVVSHIDMLGISPVCVSKYIRRGLRVAVLLVRAMRRPWYVEQQSTCSTLFLRIINIQYFVIF